MFTCRALRQELLYKCIICCFPAHAPGHALTVLCIAFLCSIFDAQEQFWNLTASYFKDLSKKTETEEDVRRDQRKEKANRRESRERNLKKFNGNLNWVSTQWAMGGRDLVRVRRHRAKIWRVSWQRVDKGGHSSVSNLTPESHVNLL